MLLQDLEILFILDNDFYTKFFQVVNTQKNLEIEKDSFLLTSKLFAITI